MGSQKDYIRFIIIDHNEDYQNDSNKNLRKQKLPIPNKGQTNMNNHTQ